MNTLIYIYSITKSVTVSSLRQFFFFKDRKVIVKTMKTYVEKVANVSIKTA